MDHNKPFGDLLAELVKTQLEKLAERGEEINIQNVVDITIENLDQAIVNAGDQALSDLKSQMAQLINEQRAYQEGFEGRLLELWRRPLNLLEYFRMGSLEIGQRFNANYRAQAEQESDFLFKALIRLHARGCLVTSEILALLRSGHASGAYSRWRTLHEIAVIAVVLSENDKELAERYLLHNVIESYKAANQYEQKFRESRQGFEAHGYQPLSAKELKELVEARKKLLKRFGKDFGNDYGWAARILNNPRPNFAQIENFAGFVVSRPFYKLASHSVHAQPKAIWFDIGLNPTLHQHLMLAGPSHFGLADPGQATTTSLFQITLALLSTKPTMLNMIYAHMLSALSEETKTAFVEVHREFETETPAP